MLRIVGICTLMLFILACDRDDDDIVSAVNAEAFIFGEFNGFCAGDDCIKICMIDQEEFYMDTLHEYPSISDGAVTSFVKLDTVYSELLDLREQAPQELFDQQNVVLGMPDAYDQGGVYLEFRAGGQRTFYLIDADTTNLPGYLHQYLIQINEAIQMIYD